MGRKKTSEKVAEIKAVFESIDISLTDEQVLSFINTFDAREKEKLEEMTSPFSLAMNKMEAKNKEYQQRNYELQAKLDEAHNMASKFDTILETKIKELNDIKIPVIPNMEKMFDGVIKSLEIKSKKLDSMIETVNEKLISYNVEEQFKKIPEFVGLLEKQQINLANLIVNTESTKITELTEALNLKQNETNTQQSEIVKLQEAVNKEREVTEVTLLLETSPLDTGEKEIFYNICETSGFGVAKENIKKFIQMKEEKQNERPINPQRTNSLLEESRGIKTRNDVGTLQKRRPMMTESMKMNDMDAWVSLAGVEDKK